MTDKHDKRKAVDKFEREAFKARLVGTFQHPRVMAFYQGYSFGKRVAVSVSSAMVAWQMYRGNNPHEINAQLQPGNTLGVEWKSGFALAVQERFPLTSDARYRPQPIRPRGIQLD